MIQKWFHYLRAGLARSVPADKLAVENIVSTLLARLRNLQPYLTRHWRQGVVSVGVVLFTSLLSFPQPLVYRFLVDDVMLARRLDLPSLEILLMGGIKVLSMAAGPLRQYYFTRFEQAVMLDLQHNVLDHALSLPKSFFDDKEVGYLLSRISSDVLGLRWFFS